MASNPADSLADPNLPPYKRRMAEAIFAASPAELLALETGHMLFFPRSHITSKGFVDRSRLRRYPPVSLVTGLIGLRLIGKTEAELDSLVLAAEAEEQEWYHRQRQQPIRPTTSNRLANTRELLANLGDLKL